MPVTRVSSTRRTCGICVDVQTVISSLMPMGAATTARGSMNAGISRWLTKRRLTTTSAFAATSSKPPPNGRRRSRCCSATSSWTRPVPGETASTMSTTAGRGSYSTSTYAIASSAEARHSSPGPRRRQSPTCRTLSPVSAGNGGMTRVVGDRPHARDAGVQVAQARRVVGRDDVRHGEGGGQVDLGDAGVGHRAAHDAHVQGARELDVVGPVRAAVEELRVLLATDRAADRVSGIEDLGHFVPPISISGVLHGLDDVVVPGAAAQVAVDAVADLLLGRIRVLRQQVDGRHDHAWRAVAALQAVALLEGRLHGVPVITCRQALDRRDLRPVGLDGEDAARLHAASVQQHGAGAAVGRVATHHRADLAQVVAEPVDEQGSGFDVRFVVRPVDGDGDVLHGGSLSVGVGAPAGRPVMEVTLSRRAAVVEPIPRTCRREGDR